MSDEQVEPGELTERFQAFAHSVDPEPGRTLPVALLVAGAVLVLAMIVVVWIAVAG